MTGHLGDGAAEVHVDVVDVLGIDQLLDCLGEIGGVGAVELDAARRLVGPNSASFSVLRCPRQAPGP